MYIFLFCIVSLLAAAFLTVSPTIKSAEDKKKHQHEEALIYRDNGETVRIPLSNLEYAEKSGENVIFHLVSGKEIVRRQSMAELVEELRSNRRFVIPHDSYIVNACYISNILNISMSDIIMENGNSVPVTKENYSIITNAFLKYRFGNK